MDFSLFPTVLSKKEPNIAQEKSESAEMWKIQLIWGFWWHYKSGGGLYKFGGGSRMAVTSNCVNEKKFFPVGIRRGDPKYSNSYQLIPVHRQMMAVEAVKEKFYCFLGIVHPTYYQSRGWGPWLAQMAQWHNESFNLFVKIIKIIIIKNKQNLYRQAAPIIFKSALGCVWVWPCGSGGWLQILGN